MGSWNESCGVTSLPVQHGDKVRYMIIRKVRRRKVDHAVFYPFDIFQPVSRLIEGEYDDYGGIDTSEESKAILFKSLEACGVEAPEADMHGHFRVNDDQFSLPLDHYHWFLREDAFQMLKDLPLRDETKTLGEAEQDTLKKVLEAAEEITNKSAVFGSLMGGYEIGQAFGRLEMPRPPIYPILKEEVIRSITVLAKEEAEAILNGNGESFAEVSARLPKPDLSRVPVLSQPLLDLNRILYGMLILRKMLHPMGGAGSQSWNDTAYEVYGKFVADTATAYRKSIEDYD